VGNQPPRHQRKAILCREIDHRARTPQATYLRGRFPFARWDNWRVGIACGSAYRSRRFAGLGVQAAQPTTEPLQLPRCMSKRTLDLGGNRKLRSISCNFALSAQRPLFLLPLTTLSFTTFHSLGSPILTTRDRDIVKRHSQAPVFSSPRACFRFQRLALLVPSRRRPTAEIRRQVAQSTPSRRALSQSVRSHCFASQTPPFCAISNPHCRLSTCACTVQFRRHCWPRRRLKVSSLTQHVSL
jgi:hypothetical protein